MAYNFQVGHFYTFEVWPAQILQSRFTNVQILGILTHTEASKEADVAALHAEIMPTLPQGTPASYTATIYIKIRSPSGATTVIGVVWIKEASVQEVTSSRITVVIEDVTPDDIEEIRNVLIHRGYNNIQLTME